METTHRIVDRLDLESESSETAHEFVEVFDPDSPYGHNCHDKVLAYLSEDGFKVVRDAGRRIFHQATWKANGISADQDLIVVVRHDHTGDQPVSGRGQRREASNRNGVSTSSRTVGRAPGLAVPREFLRDGENTFRITRDRTDCG